MTSIKATTTTGKRDQQDFIVVQCKEKIIMIHNIIIGNIFDLFLEGHGSTALCNLIHNLYTVLFFGYTEQ